MEEDLHFSNRQVMVARIRLFQLTLLQQKSETKKLFNSPCWLAVGFQPI